MIVKVCGIKEELNYRAIVDAGADWIGLNFYPQSQRFIEKESPVRYKEEKRVGIFVNERISEIFNLISQHDLDAVQIHGMLENRTFEQLKEITEVIMAIGVLDAKDFNQLDDLEGCLCFVLDTKSPLFGGSGKKFDWNILKDYNLSAPFLLSGGISPADVEILKNFPYGPLYGVDINSRFESAPGVKDVELVSDFINKLKI